MEKLDEEPHGVPRRAKENREFYRTTITSSFLVFYLLKRQWYAFFKGLFKAVVNRKYPRIPVFIYFR